MFIPKRILFQKNALDYEIGRNIYDFFKANDKVEIIKLNSNRIKENIPGEDLYNYYGEGKKTLVVGLTRVKKFQTCKPSAHYQLPLLAGCPGQCQYCYLNTNLGDRPYMKVNVNVNDIFENAQKYISERLPEHTIFEGSATSDPIPIEPYSSSLKQAIEFFSKNENGRFRFVTKYTDVNTLLNINHGGHTEIRFTLNTDHVINNYESKTPSLGKRIEACKKVIEAEYPMGFLIAPIFIYDDWKTDYRKLLIDLRKELPGKILHPLTFEIISHRYTTKAKNIILEVFPKTELPMDNEDRTYKYGQFGYGKYVYDKETIAKIKDFFNKEINNIFDSEHVIKYII